jgi:hypothetical protein
MEQLGGLGRAQVIPAGFPALLDQELASAVWASMEALRSIPPDRGNRIWTTAHDVAVDVTRELEERRVWSAYERAVVQTYVTAVVTLWIVGVGLSESQVANLLSQLLGALGICGLAAWSVAGKAYDKWRGL